MFEEIKNIQSEKSDLRKFGITIGVILLVIAGFLFWKEKESYKLFLAIGSTLLLTAIALPSVLKPVYWIWMIFAIILGWFMSHVTLSLFYYVIVTPISLIARLFGKQFLELKWDKSKESYWKYRSSNSEKEDYEKQF